MCFSTMARRQFPWASAKASIAREPRAYRTTLVRLLDRESSIKEASPAPQKTAYQNALGRAEWPVKLRTTPSEEMHEV